MSRLTAMMALVMAVAVLLGAVAPATAQSREHQQMAAELRMLQEQQQQLSIAVSQLAEAIKALHPRFDESNNAVRGAIANLELTIKNMANDLSAIRAQAQETGTRIGSLSDEIEALRNTLEALPGQLSQALTPPAPVDPNAPASSTGALTPPVATPPAPVISTSGQSPTRMLTTAKSDYFQGQYSLAITGFDALLKQFPTSTAAAEAQFLIGESYWQEKKTAEAIAAYSAVIQNHPKSSFVPEAYYKRGVAQQEANQPDAARASYEAAVKNYPDTAAATLSQQRLAGLKPAATPTPNK
jgi:tol-pal system protein YbgF